MSTETTTRLCRSVVGGVGWRERLNSIQPLSNWWIVMAVFEVFAHRCTKTDYFFCDMRTKVRCAEF